MARRPAALVREAIGERMTVGKLMATIGPRQSVSHTDKLVVAALQLVLADMRELAELAAATQREALDILHRRINKNIDDMQRLLTS